MADLERDWSWTDMQDAHLLLDTVEDTETTPEELSGAFGSSVAAVVEEVTVM